MLGDDDYTRDEGCSRALLYMSGTALSKAHRLESWANLDRPGISDYPMWV